MARRWILLISICLFLTGCSSYNLYQGVYEGVRVRDQLGTTPPERAGKPEPPTYQQYEIMRNEQVK